MKKKPRDPKESFFAKGAGARAIIGGTLMGTLTLVAFYLGLREHGYSPGSQNIPEEVLTYARTMSFVVIVASQLFFSLSMRSATKSILRIGLFTNKYLIGAIILGFLLQFGVISIPVLAGAFKVQNLSLGDWGLVIILALVPLVVNEIIKVFMKAAYKD